MLLRFQLVTRVLPYHTLAQVTTIDTEENRANIRFVLCQYFDPDIQNVDCQILNSELIMQDLLEKNEASAIRKIVFFFHFL